MCESRKQEHKLPISVCIVARNEEANIRDCLASVDFAEEIVLVDDFSSDKTREIAESAGVKVFQRAMNGNWGAQQTFAINQASQDWILLLDCDERITPKLVEEITKKIRDGARRAYKIRRINHFCKRLVKHGVLRPDYVVRLMPRAGTYVEGFVHPKIVCAFPEEKLSSPMLHYTYESWDSYFRKFNQYTRLAAEKAFSEGKRAIFFRDVLVRPVFAFFKMYLFQAGLLDGRIGWILSANHGFYTAAKYYRLYYLQKDRQSRKTEESSGIE